VRVHCEDAPVSSRQVLGSWTGKMVVYVEVFSDAQYLLNQRRSQRRIESNGAIRRSRVQVKVSSRYLSDDIGRRGAPAISHQCQAPRLPAWLRPSSFSSPAPSSRRAHTTTSEHCAFAVHHRASRIPPAQDLAPSEFALGLKSAFHFLARLCSLLQLTTRRRLSLSPTSPR
jgi:hypothetical protein